MYVAPPKGTESGKKSLKSETELAGNQIRYIPIRSCISCGNKVPKEELTRLVATSQGCVLVDHTDKMDGRGAYLCKNEGCDRQGLKRRRLEYALRTKIEDQQWRRLIIEIKMLTVKT